MAVKIHPSGRKMMDREDAITAAKMFREIGGFSEVRIDEWGFETGCYCVQLWSVNAKAGNRNLTTVDHLPASMKEAKLIAKRALGKANARDKEALGRIATERTLDAE